MPDKKAAWKRCAVIPIANSRYYELLYNCPFPAIMKYTVFPDYCSAIIRGDSVYLMLMFMVIHGAFRASHFYAED